MSTKHRYGSFDYKVINEQIKTILDARSKLDTTVQVGMPFVKATTTLRHPILGGNGTENMGFTLGLHGITKDMHYEEMYSSAGGAEPLIGYTYSYDGNEIPVYSVNPYQNVQTSIANIFDTSGTAFSYPDQNFVRIPPPGITNVTVGRNKNGLLVSAQLQINVPSLQQLEALHRVFLVPGMGMVLEWGQQFADIDGQITDLSPYLFPWRDRTRLLTLLLRLAKREVGLDEILNDYVYPSNGQYMWMFGRVANFQIHTNSDGSYNVAVKIVGPSEDAWAYSTKTTVIPKKDLSTNVFCADGSISAYSYFHDTSIGGYNLITLLSKVADEQVTEPDLVAWRPHVFKIDGGNAKPEGDPGKDPTKDKPGRNVSGNGFGDDRDAYFMTWKFFVNVVINSELRGIRGLFKRAGLDDEKIKTIGLLLPYAHGENREITDVATIKNVDDPKEPFVGYNKYLRSVDPGTLIVVNEKAVEYARQNSQYDMLDSKDKNKFTSNTQNSDKFYTKFSNVLSTIEGGAIKYINPQEQPMDEFTKRLNTPTETDPDKAFLSSGVWINHKALVEAMLSADTILRGITNLLDRMNAATMGYWNLTLDAIEGTKELPTPNSYTVIDANFRENSTIAVTEFLDKVHTFNKYVRNNKGILVGSEVIESSIDLSLPKRLFSQIATLGLLTPGEIDAATGQQTELEKIKSIKISDPNDTLRKMFSITSLVDKDESGRGPDLTILPNIDQPSICKGGNNTQTPAFTAGNSNQVGATDLRNNNPKDIENAKNSAKETIESDFCKQCGECTGKGTTAPVANQTFGAFDKQAIASEFQYLAVDSLSGGSFSGYISKELLADVNSAVQAVAGGRPYTKYRAIVSSLIRPRAGNESNGVLRRHPLGLAIDIAGVIIDGKSYALTAAKNISADSYTTERERIAVAEITKIADKLGSMGYKLTTSESGVPKSLIWQSPNHYSHLHVGRKTELSTQPPPTPPTTPNTTGTCSDSVYIKAAELKKASARTAVLGVEDMGLAGNSEVSSLEREAITRLRNNNITNPTQTQIDVEIGKAACRECVKSQQILEQNTKIEETKEMAAMTVREFPGLTSVFRYVEPFRDYMVAQIANDADGNKSNAFGAAPGALSIAGNLVLPGINGLRVGELFWIDRIPAFYKAFGAFQVMSIEDNIGIDGWKTTINARFNYLGTEWRDVMLKKLSGIEVNTQTPTSQPQSSNLLTPGLLGGFPSMTPP